MRRERGNGAQGRNRTTDTAIFSRMLYQLSYLGIGDGSRYSMLLGRSSSAGRIGWRLILTLLL